MTLRLKDKYDELLDGRNIIDVPKKSRYLLCFLELCFKVQDEELDKDVLPLAYQTYKKLFKIKGRKTIKNFLKKI